MKDRPILFSAQMVRAILAGTKTQTRRPVKSDITGPNPPGAYYDWRDKKTGKWVAAHGAPFKFADCNAASLCPYGQPGDRLWVREAWRTCVESDATAPRDMDAAYRVWFEADAPHQPGAGRVRASMHMPRWASRITLEIADVRVERLTSISEAEARSEGASFHNGGEVGHSGWRHDHGDVHADARSSFARLWESINGPGSWDANPWVWVVKFRRVA